MERYLSTAQVAEILGVTPLTLRRWRQQGVGPDYFQAVPGGNCRYPESALHEWAARRTV